MNKSWYKVVSVGLLGLAGAAQAGAALAGAPKPAPAAEPAGFVSGAVVGGFAAGPFGAVIGAGIGTWLGNRVHRAGEAKVAEAQVAELMSDKNELIENNRTLTAQLATMSQEVEKARTAQADPTPALKGLKGDVLFRTGSFELEPVMSQQVPTATPIRAAAPRTTSSCPRRAPMQSATSCCPPASMSPRSRSMPTARTRARP
jgi:hypothetical protein